MAADAQVYGPPKSILALPPQQLDKCKTLGIEPENCNEKEILSHLCIGAIGAPCGGTGRPPELDPVVLSVIIGCGVAFAIGTIAIIKIRNVRTKRLGE
ncbi:MAG TPA: hypothetical protein VJP79_06175 [Nitrososphaera sp.]|nr:hypothetical protein [Nitrososphaera sp.]